MKDIDFDELDRAVSSVLSKSTPADSSATVPVEPSADKSAPTDEAPTQRAVTPEPQDTPTSQTPTSEATASSDTLATTPETTPAAPSPITLRPRGKFMDVMHPSADMNPGASSDRPAFTPPRTLAPLTPRNIDQPEPTATVDEATSLIGAEPAPVIDTQREASASRDEHEETLLLPAETDEETPDTPSETETISTAPSNYVDPLDVAASTSTAASDEAPRSENTPQATPFLSDTKVDKRPLGAFGDPDEKDAEESKDINDDTQTAPVVPLPRELQPDVVQVESVQEPDQPAVTDKPFAAPVGVATDSTDDGRVEGHPLFDTSTYHEPIASVHTKRTAPWVFWAVGLGICLVIGAGVGYFLFTAGF